MTAFSTAPAGLVIAAALLKGVNRAGHIKSHGETQWASATFTGARHALVVRFVGADAFASAGCLQRKIKSDDIEIPGQLIVEMKVVRVTHELHPAAFVDVEVSALTLAVMS